MLFYLLDSNRDQFESAHTEIGCNRQEVGQLMTPLSRRADFGASRFAIDNGGYKRAEPQLWKNLIDRHYSQRNRCLFVTLPDVVGNARRTLELFGEFYWVVRGWRRALVVQDGMEDMTIPWAKLDAIFVGGTDRFKQSQASADIIRSAKWLGKWVHVGRVNGWMRHDWCEANGVDSIDGSGIARYSEQRKNLRRKTLFTELETP